MKTNHPQNQQLSNLLTIKFISRAICILIPLALLHFYLFPFPININQPNINLPQPKITKKYNHFCNYTNGQWIKSQFPPLYNVSTCKTIKDGQNCMAHGRPDTRYLYYRWQPKGCNLHQFNALSFLNLIQNKHLAFVGDSMARNQLESLLCLISSASNPKLVYRGGEENKFRRWVFESHNVTVSVLWSPFLVKGVEKSAALGLNHNKLYLDSADERWVKEIENFDIVVFSIGHWFLHPAIFHENEEVIGCHHCPEFNHTEIGFFDVFRKAIKTTLKVAKEKHASSSSSSSKFVVLTTFSPAHFEGEWDKAGACPRKEPYKEGEKKMEYMDEEMRKIEVEEVEIAMKEQMSSKRMIIEALDVTRMAMMRPDGHPGPYMHPNPFKDGITGRVQNDCVHWCLPGPVDAWNEILFEMVKRWKDDRRQLGD